MLTRFLFVLIALLIAGSQPAHAEDRDLDTSDILATLTEELSLTEEQTPKVQEALDMFTKELEAATALADEEEPDNQKILGEIKKARGDFRGRMKDTLTKEQYETFDAMVEEVIQGMFDDIAAIRIMDLEPVLDLTEEQSEALIPVMSTAIHEVMSTLYEYGDKKLRAPQKLKLGRHLKEVQSEMNKGMSKILTEEQMTKYEALQEEQKKS